VTTAKHSFRSRTSFDDKKMWTLDHARDRAEPERVAQPDDPEQREEHMAEYRKGCHQVNRGQGVLGKEQSGCSFPTAGQHGQEG